MRTFWRAIAASSTRDTWVSMPDMKLGDDLRLTEAVARGEQPDGPVHLKVGNRGKYRGDLLHASGGFYVVASLRLVGVLEDMGATGWVTAPVEIRYPSGEELTGYRLLVTTGRCADFRMGRGDNADEEAPVDVSIGWDGSDVFWWEAPSRGFLVTDRVKRAFEEAGLQRIIFEIPTS